MITRTRIINGVKTCEQFTDEQWLKDHPVPNFEGLKTKRLADSKEWGPAKWKELHNRINQKEFDLSTESEWLKVFAKTLPCNNCRFHWREITSKTPPNFSSKEAYFEWTVFAHNQVNKSLGKPIFTIEQASSLLDR